MGSDHLNRQAGMLGAFVSATRHSWQGLVFAFRSERHIREEAAVLAASIPAAWLIASDGWSRIALVASLVNLIVVELLNTSIEKLCDHVQLDHHALIKAVKDMGSAAVLGALLIACAVWGFASWQRFFG